VKDGVDDSTKVDIGFHYMATVSASSTVPLDTDGDGLYDYIEDANGDGILNSDESSIALADSDYDYLSDLVERQIGSNPRSNDTDGDGALDGDEYWNGTNPSAPGDYPPAVVESLRMNSGNFASDNALTPTYSSATATNSFDGLAASFSNSGQRLVYPTTVVTGGITRPTIYFQNGSVRFTYIPDWYAGSVTNQPGTWLRLIECGSWRLTIDPTGTRLLFQTGSTNVSPATNLDVSLSKPPGLSGRLAWEIALSYTAAKSAVSINGAPTAFGKGVELGPTSAELAAGWCIGNSLGATNHCKGVIDNLETFNTAFLLGSPNRSTLTVFGNAARYAQLASASVATNGIRLEWIRGWEGDWLTNSDLYSIKRRAAGSLGSYTTIATDVRTNAWVDTTAALGGYYDYKIGRHPDVQSYDVPTLVPQGMGRSSTGVDAH
jgi:Bacterial TSP3 repeat